jgi:PASTA domain
VVLAVLSALLVILVLMWDFPNPSSELAAVLPFSDGAPSEDRGAAHQPAVGGQARGDGAGEAERIEVPDVSGRDVGEAMQILSRAGFEVTAIKAVKSPQEGGTVLKAKPSKVGAAEKQVVIVMSGGQTGIPPWI